MHQFCSELPNIDALSILDVLVKRFTFENKSFGDELKSRFLNRDFHSFVELPLNLYTDYSVDDARNCRQIHAFVQKNASIDLGIDLEKVAYDKFVESESGCKKVNERLRDRSSLDWDVEGVLYLAQCKIASILGDVPPLSDLRFSFGPGANTNVNGRIAGFRTKLSAPLECSTNFLPYVGEFMNEFPMWADFHENQQSSLTGCLEVVPTVGKLAFVPKDCRSHRTIIVEPLLNSLYQKGVGRYIKDRLAKYGVNLRDQTRNQRLAEWASINNSLATVDLSSASDSIAYGLVLDLLPPPWFDFLDRVRTPAVSYKGSVIYLQKFSSMGNAFTFELESLIFYAISHSVCKQLDLNQSDISVYGDDIIIPSTALPLLKKVFDFVGFTINTRKSYSDGPFRESCGCDYMSGIDIRPFYLKEQLSIQKLFVMHNWFYRRFEFDIAASILSVIPPSFLLFGPDGYGDGHLLGEWIPVRKRRTKRDGWDGSYFDTLELKPRKYHKLLPGDYLVPGYSIYVAKLPQDFPIDPYTVRGSSGVIRRSIYTHRRCIFGGY